ncbi:MAG: lysylphosphatidylglycerol synthase transmembrane domain-containing protein [Gemmatimonadota bacterium]
MKLDWKAVVGVAISGVLLWWLFRDQDAAQIWAQIRSANLLLFLLATAIAVSAYAVRAWRWRLLLRPVCPETSFYHRWATTHIGFMANNLLPARVGEFVRAYALARVEPVSVSGAFGSLVVARFLDGIAVVALLVVAVALPSFPTGVVVFGQPLAGFVRGVVITLGALLVIIATLVLVPGLARWGVRQVGRVLPEKGAHTLAAMTDHFLNGLSVLRDVRLFAGALALSLLHWSWYGISFLLGLRAFHIDVGYGAALFTQSMVAFGAAVPSAPGFFGTWHAAAKVALVDAYGVPEAQALAFATGYHLAGFLPITALGLYYAWRLGIHVTQVEAPAEAPQPEPAV